MLRLILSASLLPSLLAASPAPAEPQIVYTRHTLKVDVRDLNLGREADRRVLQARLADAADEVCGGRPDRGNRYTEAELKRMLPAYDQCHTDAVRSALASLHSPVVAELAPPPHPER